jgi:hypothetical protein
MYARNVLRYFMNIQDRNKIFQKLLDLKGTPTKRQVSKRLKRQVYKRSGLQNVRFTKCQVYKTSGCKQTSICMLYLWSVEMFAGKGMAVFYSLF